MRVRTPAGSSRAGAASWLDNVRYHALVRAYFDRIAPGSQVLACARRGVDVIQQDIEAGLDVFAGSRFDVVVLSMAILATHQTERVLREKPYRWYDTPNLHMSTPKDFEGFLAGLGLAITRRAFLADGRPVGVMAGLRCTQAIYGLRVR